MAPDALRTLAILIVMLWHVPKGTAPALLDGVRSFSWAGVDLFFVLSGYLIGSQLLGPVAVGRSPDLFRFYVRRAFRILPAFLAVLLVYLSVPSFPEAPLPMPAWRFLTFTMNFGLPGGGFSHAWSLCVEEHFYLLLPLLVLGLRQTKSAVPAIVLASAILVAGMALRFAIWRQVIGEPLAAHASPGNYLEAIYYPTYCRLDGLLFGVLLAAMRTFRPELWRRLAPPPVALALGIAMTVVGLMLFQYRGDFTYRSMPWLSLPGAVFGYPAFALGIGLILSAGLDAEASLRVFRIPGLRGIATLSYSLYLTHKAVMHLDRLWLGDDRLTGWFGILVYLSSSLIVAAILYVAVERPSVWVRDFILRRQSARA